MRMNSADGYQIFDRMDNLKNDKEYFQLRKRRKLEYILRSGVLVESISQTNFQKHSYRKYATYKNFVELLSRTFILLLIGSLPLLTLGQLSTVSPEKIDCPGLCICANLNFTNFLLPDWVIKYAKPSSSVILLNCDNVVITSIPSNVQNGTEIFNLANNRISRISSSNLLGYKNATAINLNHNVISEINETAFQGLGFLKALSLKENLISDLSWLQSLAESNILYLDLSFNVIDEIVPKYFDKLYFLERLDLSHNHIAFIDSYSFAPTSLNHLDLSSNLLADSSLRPESLARINKLVYLSMASNRALTKLPDLQELGLTSSDLQTLNLFGLPFVNTIKAGYFRSIPNLRNLNLSYSGIETLERGWLSGGPSKTLEMLDLSFNRLKAIYQNTFVDVSDSRDFSNPLSYKNSKLSSLPYVVSPSVGLAQSDVRMLSFANYDTILESDAKWYQPLEALTYLSLSNNPALKYLHNNAFTYLPKLQLLFLQNCNISQLKIASDANKFKDDGLKLTLPNLTHIWVFNNPLYCDCSIKTIKLAATSLKNGCDDANLTSYIFVDSQFYLYQGSCYKVSHPRPSWCILPQNLKVFPIFEVEPNRLTCADEPYDILYVVMIGPATFAGSIFLIFLCGSCSVCVRRIRRYKSGMYQLMDEKQALITRDYPRRVKERSAFDVIFSMDHLRYSPTFTHSSDGAPHTNLVLGEFHRSSTSNLEKKPHHTSRGQIDPLPTSSRITSRPLITLRRPTKTTSNYDESSFSDGLIMKSCPDLSKVVKFNTDFWRHEIGNENRDQPTERSDLLPYIDDHYTTERKSLLEIPSSPSNRGGSVSTNYSESSSNSDFALKEIKGMAYKCNNPDSLTVSFHNRKSLPDSYTKI